MEQASQPAHDRDARGRRGLLIVAIALAALIAAGALAFLFIGGDDDGDGQAAIPLGEPTIVSEDELRSFGRSQSVPVYWAGARPDSEYELTRTDDGRVFIRYLPDDAEPGDPRPRFLTVATYAQPNAYTFLRNQSRRDGWTGERTASGALVANAESRPTSVYFAFPDADLQVEVYDPKLGEARDLVLGGEIRRLE